MKTGRKDTTRLMVEFLARGRQNGKTTNAIAMALELARNRNVQVVLVVLHQQERQRLLNTYPALWEAVQAKQVRVETPDTMRRGEHEKGRSRVQYVIDNADLILASMLNTRGSIEMITWTI